LRQKHTKTCTISISKDIASIKVCWHFSLIRLAHTHFQYFGNELLERKQSLLQKRKQWPLKWLRELPPGGACMVEMWKRLHEAAKLLRTDTKIIMHDVKCECPSWPSHFPTPIHANAPFWWRMMNNHCMLWNSNI
jgi:hypothetical protein